MAPPAAFKPRTGPTKKNRPLRAAMKMPGLWGQKEPGMLDNAREAGQFHRALILLSEPPR